MNKADVLFLDLYKSIRGDWSGGIINRGEVLLKLLKHTTLYPKLIKYFKEHFQSMNKAFGSEYFDGRDWARDSSNSYDDLMKTKWYDKDYYKKYSLYEKSFEEFTDRYPAFTSNNYLLNHLLPQLRGGKSNQKELDNHSDTSIEVTNKMVNDFVGIGIIKQGG